MEKVYKVAQFKLPTIDQIGLPGGPDTAQDIFQSVINAVFGIAGAGFLIMILYGGFLFLTAAGNQQQVERAKGTLTNAAIGLILIVIAFPIVTYVKEVLKINL